MNHKKRVLAIGAMGPEFDQTADLPASTIPTESANEGAPGWTVVCEVGENTVVKLSQRDHILARIDAAKREILVADSMVKLMDFRSKADALRQLVRVSRDMQLINLANELKLRCETQLGEMLRKTHLSKGGRPSKPFPMAGVVLRCASLESTRISRHGVSDSLVRQGINSSASWQRREPGNGS